MLLILLQNNKLLKNRTKTSAFNYIKKHKNHKLIKIYYKVLDVLKEITFLYRINATPDYNLHEEQPNFKGTLLLRITTYYRSKQNF